MATLRALFEMVVLGSESWQSVGRMAHPLLRHYADEDETPSAPRDVGHLVVLTL